MEADSYLDIGDYGVIGNLETVALVGKNGSIDWFPAPHLESQSVFARILDSEKGGHFSISPAESFESDRKYVPKTNVLKTSFETKGGKAVLTDYMPLYSDESPGEEAIIRKVKGIEGSVETEVDFSPRFNYGRTEPMISETSEGMGASSEEIKLKLQAPSQLNLNKDFTKCSFEVKGGEEYWFSLTYGEDLEKDFDYPSTLSRTKDFWEGWAHSCEEGACAFHGPWHEFTVRAGLVLKLLTHTETGAIAAAPTTSLPEDIGGIRNWDYRFAWIRDASMTIQSLFHLGHEEEAKSFFGWLRKLSRTYDDPSDLQIMYGLHGKTDLEEEKLEHLSGYRGSSPVRVGNAASNQKQLDIYGELVNAFYETCPSYGEEIKDEDWRFIRRVVDHVAEVWEEKDAGIWEVRGENQHFLYSKLMCWVALDRGIKIGESWNYEGPFDSWKEERSKVRKAILESGYSEEVGSFVQSFESKNLDATSLLIPLLEFLPPDDPRVENTIDTTIESLTSEEGLVYRYDGDDGLEGDEGAFLLCSFWLVRALTAAGREDEAEDYLGNLIEYTNPVGLLAEEIDPSTGKQLGNFPQAFSHIGLINSVLYLGASYGRETKDAPLAGPTPE